MLQIRKDKKKVNVFPDAVTQAIESDTEVKQIETEQILYRAIGKLDEVDRLMMMMVLEEVAYEEIAGIMGTTENNLRVKIHRIKTKLKTLIENERRTR